jgi:glycosyltransferase involved in cell wall biosynthesis
MRAVHLRKSFLSLSQTFIYDSIRALTECGIDVHVVTPERENEEMYPFDNVHVVPWPSLLHPGVLFERIRGMLRTGKREPSMWPIFRARLKEKIRKLSPDVLHAHFGKEGVWLAPVAASLDVPLVISFYGYDLSQLVQRSLWRKKYRDVLWPAADAAVFLSRDMEKDARRLGFNGEGHIVHLGRDLNQFPYRPPDRSVRRFLTVGRLVPKKGHRDAIRAVERISESGSDVHLRIVGDGPLHSDLQRYVEENELQDVIEFAGAKPSDEIPDEMRRADAFLLCSKVAESGDKEGTPTVLVEAQATGLPCVSTRHAGIPETVPSANHRFLAPEGDVEAIRNCLERLMDASLEEVRQVSRAGRDHVEKNFSIRKEVRKITEIYRNVKYK